MTSGKSDPNYGPALEAVRSATAAISGTNPATGQPYAPEYAGLPAELTALQARLLDDAEEAQEVSRWISSESAHIESLAKGAKRLSEGLYEISAGGKEVAKQAARIDRETTKLAGGLGRLGSGANELAGGLTQLTGGTTELQHRLAEGYSQSYPLQTGSRRIAVRVLSQSDSLNRRAAKLRRTSPGIFNSGYFVLSALDGTRAAHARTSLRSDRPQRRRPGGDDHRLLALRIQLARLDRAQQDARSRRRRARQGSEHRHRRRRRPADTQHLQPRHQGPDPLHSRGDHARHLPRPDPRPAGAAAGGDRGRPQPGHGRRRLRHPHPAHQRPRRLAAGWPHLR